MEGRKKKIELSEHGGVSEVDSRVLRQLNQGIRNQNIDDGNWTDGNEMKSKRY